MPLLHAQQEFIYLINVMVLLAPDLNSKQAYLLMASCENCIKSKDRRNEVLVYHAYTTVLWDNLYGNAYE